MSMIGARLHAIVTGTYPARPVGVVRIILGTAALLRGLEAIRIFDRIVAESTVDIPWADWIPEPTTPLASSVLVVWLASAVLFAFGYRSQLTGAVLAAAMAFSVALDQQAYANHLYLLIVLVALTTLARPGSALSVDARRTGTTDRTPAWPVLLIKIQVTVVYVFAGITKLNDDFLSGDQLRANLGRGLVEVPGWVTDSPTVEILAVLVVITELSIATFLWIPKRRPLAIGLGFLLHLSIPIALADPVQLVVFSTEMLAAYLLFLDVEPQTRIVVWDNSCDFCAGWKRRLERLDVLEAVEWLGSGSETDRVHALGVTSEEADRAMQLAHGDHRREGFAAVQEVLSVSPWTYLVAPFMLLPPLRAIGDRWYRRRAIRRACGLQRPVAQE